MKRIAIAVALAGLLAPALARSSVEIVDKPVAFTVVNKNDSLVPCNADGRSYTVRGSLITPASALASETRAVTLYIHGTGLSGDRLWRLRLGGNDSFDFGLAMARLGHASVAVELVGYGSSVRSDGPDGTLVCQGSHADVIHQVVEHLRAGTYTYGDSPAGPSFGRVGLAGMSYGGHFANPAVYSFGGVDALVIMGFSEPIIPTPDGAVYVAIYGSRCIAPDHKYDDGSGPPGYHLFPHEGGHLFFNDPDPAFPANVTETFERDPCGQLSSFAVRSAVDIAHLGEITIPVLIAVGDHDAVYGQPGPQIYLERYTGSPDRTLMLFPGAGHGFFLERNRARWIGMIAGWLRGHDL